jgi:hypothetical protein
VLEGQLQVNSTDTRTMLALRNYFNDRTYTSLSFALTQQGMTTGATTSDGRRINMRDGSNAEDDGKSGNVSTRTGVYVYNGNLAVEQVRPKSTVPHLSLKTGCVHASTPVLAKTISFCLY